MNGQVSFFAKPEPITDIKDVKEYDIVVIGAGSPGIPCAFKAAELGAKVAIVQKLKSAMAGGNFGAGLVLEKSDPYDVQRLVTLLEASSDHRAKRGLLEMWAHHSGEAVRWTIELAKEAGAQVKDLGTPVHAALLKRHGLQLEFTTCVFGPKPYNTGQGMKAICSLAQAKGIDIYYGTPAEQLVQGETGRITGVIAKSPDGYIQLNAKKGVVVATGDYANNDEMMHYYLPDMDNLGRKRFGYDGDGIR
ncbi:FAD-dependent oxidoreductase [Veillonella sp.]|uniref:FAD-dependent oxidoreductase n=1 Tax=Veillonella sp. TaxID=1926307 RepID=UPI0025D8E656|nr:FAD-dependent oxidoreductase [Veillonella sp.]